MSLNSPSSAFHSLSSHPVRQTISAWAPNLQLTALSISWFRNFPAFLGKAGASFAPPLKSSVTRNRNMAVRALAAGPNELAGVGRAAALRLAFKAEPNEGRSEPQSHSYVVTSVT